MKTLKDARVGETVKVVRLHGVGGIKRWPDAVACTPVQNPALFQM